MEDKKTVGVDRLWAAFQAENPTEAAKPAPRPVAQGVPKAPKEVTSSPPDLRETQKEKAQLRHEELFPRSDKEKEPLVQDSLGNWAESKERGVPAGEVSSAESEASLRGAPKQGSLLEEPKKNEHGREIKTDTDGSEYTEREGQPGVKFPHFGKDYEFTKVAHEHKSKVPADGPVNMVLIGCGRDKKEGTHLAKDLYNSNYFKEHRKYAENSGKPWGILSAEHGFLDPNEPVDSYDTVAKKNKVAKSALGKKASTAIASHIKDSLGTEGRVHNFEILAGKDYADGFEDHVDHGGEVTRPTKGMGFGDRNSWIRKQNRDHDELTSKVEEISAEEEDEPIRDPKDVERSAPWQETEKGRYDNEDIEPMADDPFQKGDKVHAGERLGTIEHVGEFPMGITVNDEETGWNNNFAHEDVTALENDHHAMLEAGEPIGAINKSIAAWAHKNREDDADSTRRKGRDAIPQVQAEDIGEVWDTMHRGLGSQEAMRAMAVGMKGIEGREYGVYEHKNGKWQMVSRPGQKDEPPWSTWPIGGEGQSDPAEEAELSSAEATAFDDADKSGNEAIDHHLDDDGMEHLLYKNKSGQWSVRIKDHDANEVVGGWKFPDENAARKKFFDNIGFPDDDEDSEYMDEVMGGEKEAYVEPDWSALEAMGEESERKISDEEKELSDAAKVAFSDEDEEFNPEAMIPIAADDVSKLREQDVHRVMEAAGDNYEEMAEYLHKHRPDLHDEIEFGLSEMPEFLGHEIEEEGEIPDYEAYEKMFDDQQGETDAEQGTDQGNAEGIDEGQLRAESIDSGAAGEATGEDAPVSGVPEGEVQSGMFGEDFEPGKFDDSELQSLTGESKSTPKTKLPKTERQEGLFDLGKKRDLEGQNLLFEGEGGTERVNKEEEAELSKAVGDAGMAEEDEPGNGGPTLPQEPEHQVGSQVSFQDITPNPSGTIDPPKKGKIVGPASGDIIDTQWNVEFEDGTNDDYSSSELNLISGESEESHPHDQTLEDAKPYLEKGPGYVRDIADPHSRYHSAKRRGHDDKMLDHLHKELRDHIDAYEERVNSRVDKDEMASLNKTATDADPVDKEAEAELVRKNEEAGLGKPKPKLGFHEVDVEEHPPMERPEGLAVDPDDVAGFTFAYQPDGLRYGKDRGRRIKASENALKKERDKKPLFSEEIESEQPTAEERLQGFEDNEDSSREDRQSKSHEEAKQSMVELAKLSPDDQRRFVDNWNMRQVNRTPGSMIAELEEWENTQSKYAPQTRDWSHITDQDTRNDIARLEKSLAQKQKFHKASPDEGFGEEIEKINEQLETIDIEHAGISDDEKAWMDTPTGNGSKPEQSDEAIQHGLADIEQSKVSGYDQALQRAKGMWDNSQAARNSFDSREDYAEAVADEWESKKKVEPIHPDKPFMTWDLIEKKSDKEKMIKAIHAQDERGEFIGELDSIIRGLGRGLMEDGKDPHAENEEPTGHVGQLVQGLTNVIYNLIDMDPDDQGGQYEHGERAYNNESMQHAFDAINDLTFIPSGIEMQHSGKEPIEPFPKPDRTVDYVKEMKNAPRIEQEEADSIKADWKKQAIEIGKNEDNSDKIILSLFDYTGTWSQPWRDAGYQVVQWDMKLGEDLMTSSYVDNLLDEMGGSVHGVMSACPCTTFTRTGYQWWSKRHDKEGPLESDPEGPDAIEHVFGPVAAWVTNPKTGEKFKSAHEYNIAMYEYTRSVLERTAPEWHVLENPSTGRFHQKYGKHEASTDIGQPRMVMHPSHFGDPYTKQTGFWGEFNTDLPTANVEATEGSKIHSKLTGRSEVDKIKRSETPEGLAYAFFMANHNPQEKAKTDLFSIDANLQEIHRMLCKS